MDPTADPQPEGADDLLQIAPGELIVQNGRLSGVRTPLRSPVTVVGQAQGCDVRLDVDGVSPLHCLLLHGPSGLVLRDLQSVSGTCINGAPVAVCALHDGDLLSVGPFQFKIHIHDDVTALNPEEMERERDALRIQAAAVVAQQAALTEEEIRMQQQRTALERQEAQLAAHLEERRRRLLELRDQARQARAELQSERAGYEQRVAETTHEFACVRREIADDRRLVQTERRRLSELRRRLKKRWHRHWAAERTAMRRREAELAGQRHALETEGDRLHREKAALNQTRLRSNGELEISRRQLLAAWDELHHEQQAWQEQRARHQAEREIQIEQWRQREALLVEAEQKLGAEQLHWQEKRLDLQKELEGLDNRVANQRRKLAEQEQELARLESLRRASLAEPSAAASPVAAPAAAESSAVLLPTVVEADPREWHLREVEAGLQQRVSALEAIAGDLADQRLHLAEQCQRLVQTQQAWEQERDAMAIQLERLGFHLHEREQTLAGRERALSAVEGSLHQRHEEVAQLRRHLEAWQARLILRTTTWEAERDRFLVEVRSREDVAERRLAMITELRRRWHRRRRHQLERLRTEHAACEEQRQECAARREEYLARRMLLDEEQRRLAEQSMALEQYRQESLGKAANREPADQRLEELRRSWTDWTTAAQRSLTQDRLALQAEATLLQQRQRAFQQAADVIADQEADWSRRLASWEQQQATMEEERARLQQQLYRVGVQRRRLEQQVKDLHDEVERLVGVLLADGGTAAEPIGQAA
jgi:hypothetical protein